MIIKCNFLNKHTEITKKTYPTIKSAFISEQNDRLHDLIGHFLKTLESFIKYNTLETFKRGKTMESLRVSTLRGVRPLVHFWGVQADGIGR